MIFTVARKCIFLKYIDEFDVEGFFSIWIRALIVDLVGNLLTVCH